MIQLYGCLDLRITSLAMYWVGGGGGGGGAAKQYIDSDFSDLGVNKNQLMKEVNILYKKFGGL